MSETALAKLELVTVKTRVITPDDNIVDVVEEYAKNIIGPDDVVSVAESVIAISQGKLIRHEDMDVGFLARILCRFVPQKGSLSSIYGMQATMDAHGTLRVFFAMVVGLLGKIVGKPGLFYELAGRQASLIDDVTGNMPPFDKHLVLGPDDPDGVAESLKERLGCFGAAVADVNDLKRAAILGVTKGVDKSELSRILIDNPFGNASEKTPIVIIKNYAKFKKI
jgi:F420-0:gamma-glutamyl ligase-like protein